MVEWPIIMGNGIWIKKELSSKVLTLGCKYMPPRGGIAQVLWNYHNHIFEDFKFIENSRKSNVAINLLISLWALIKLIFKLLIDRKIKIVHIHTASGVSFLRATIFLKSAKLFKKKVVMHIHGGGFKEYYKSHKSFVEKNLSKCDKIITLSQGWVDFYKSIGFESVSVENVISPPVIAVPEDDGKLHLLYLGLIIDYKGIYDLIDVIAEHQEEFRGKILLHVGGNGETDVLVSKINDHGLEDIVTFEGWVSDEKKVMLMNKCKVFILPSYVEGLPLSVLEAMSYNMAILSTRVGGIPSIVIDKKNGFLFEPGDKDAIYSSIKSLVNDNELLEAMSKDNSQQIVDYYPENVAKKLIEIYNSLL